MKKIGKIGKRNIKANKILAERWEEKGVINCEIRLPGCLRNWLLQNVHRHKRWYYYDKPELLYADSEVIRGCQSCHSKLECDKELTEATFEKLR